MKNFIPKFGKCEKCGYEGTVDENSKGEKVCNICSMGEIVKQDESESTCRICGKPISECDRG